MEKLIGDCSRTGKSAYWQLRLALDHRLGGTWGDRLSLKHPSEIFRQLCDRTHGNLHCVALLADDDVLAPPAGFLSRKSSRQWAPRLSGRVKAARTIASATVSRKRRSRAVCQPGLNRRDPGTWIRSARVWMPRMRLRHSSRPVAVRARPAPSCMV